MTKRAVTVMLLVLLGACGGSDEPTMESGTAEHGVVSVENSSFAPASVQVKAGQKVVWTFRDSFGHTATADDSSFDSGTKSGGATFEHTFDKAGTFTYHCSIHPSMKGTVAVS